MLKSREILIKKQIKSKEILINKQRKVKEYEILYRYFNFNNICYTMYPHSYEIRYYTSHNLAGIYRFIEDKFFIQIDTPIPYL